MDLAFTIAGKPGLTLWRKHHGKSFDPVAIPSTNWIRAWGIAAFDYDNDGWVDLVAVGETSDGRGEVKLFPQSRRRTDFKDVTVDVGLDKIQLKDPRAIIVGDYDRDGATDLLITQNQAGRCCSATKAATRITGCGLSLKGLNDNKSAIGTKVEVFAGGNRQKFEIAGSSGYLGQNSLYLTVGLGQATQADVVRMLWPTGVLQDEVEVAGDREQKFMEIDRRGSSCPTLFVWDGRTLQVGRRTCSVPASSDTGLGRASAIFRVLPNTSRLIATRFDEKDGKLSFRFMEPMEEVVYLDQVKLLAVDHPADARCLSQRIFRQQSAVSAIQGGCQPQPRVRQRRHGMSMDTTCCPICSRIATSVILA